MPFSAEDGGEREWQPARPGAWRFAPCVLLWTLACAKQEPPPGHRPDTRPPQVTAISPAPGSVVEGLGGSLVIRFDEPISPPGRVERDIQGSPAHRYRVDVGHSTLRIRPEDGWRRNAVYRIVLSTTLSDILRNRREEPIEVTFSTGPPIADTRVAGKVWDRVSGEGVEGARTLFVATEGDSVPYTAVSAAGGEFELPAVPPGSYRAYGFMDRNRNLRLDRRLESHDSTSFTLADSASSVSLDLVLLEPDSTPPVLALVDVPDSARIRLTFDDYLLPDQQLRPDAVTLADTVTGSVWPIGGLSVLTAREVEGGEDGAPADGERGGRPGEVPSGEEAAGEMPAAERTGARDSAGQEGRASPVEPLPSRVVEIRLDRPLEEGTYRVELSEVLNVNRVSGSGDTTFAYPLSGPEGESAGAARRGDGGG